LVRGIGTGGWQIAVLVVLAMSTALLVGGGPELVTEAGVSAILLATVQVPDGGVSPDRFLDALMGGAVSLVVNAILFPVDPILLVARASQPVCLDLGASLDATARGLDVRPEEVVQLVEASDGRLVAEGAVWSSAIVEVEPAGQRGVAFAAVAVDRAVGPAGEEGSDEALGFAVGLRPVRVRM
jgi:hypothetical protein